MRDEGKIYEFIFFLAMVIVVFIILLLYQISICLAARKVGPITRTPVVVFPAHKFTVDESPDGVRFLCEFRNNRWNLNHPSVTKKLRTLLKVAGYSFVYGEARVIIIRMNGFVYGRECHEFEPVGGAAPGSYYTYQMYGDKRIQVTEYVEDGVSYLAGFCIYIPRGSLATSYRKKVVKEIITSAERRYEARFEQRASWNRTSSRLGNGEQREEIHPGNFPSANWNGKYCETLRRDVMTQTIDGAVYHKEWNNMLNVMSIHKCVECSKNDQPPAYTALSIDDIC